MARIFLAIEVSDEIRAELVRAREFLERKLGSEVRLTKPEQLHLTVVFLGEIEETEVPRAIEAARSGCQVSPFAVTLSSPGVFPESGPAAVLWVGLSDPTGALSSLADSLNVTLRRAGFRLEGRPFLPHLTLGRCRNGDPKARGVMADLQIPPLTLPVEALTVFRSERGPEGARHIPLEVIRLGLGRSR